MSDNRIYNIEQLKRFILIENNNRFILNKITPAITEIIKPFLDKNILNKDSSILKKLNDLIKEEIKKQTELIKPLIKPLKEGDFISINCYLDHSVYNLSLKLTLCYNGGLYSDDKNYKKDNPYYCIYYDSYKYFADIEDGILKKVFFIENNFINPIAEAEQLNKCIKLNEELKKEIDLLTFYKSKELI